MKRAPIVGILAVVAACNTEPDVEIIPADVVWMEWPDAVTAGAGFPLRLGVWRPCALDQRFRPAPSTGPTTLTFAPFFEVSPEPIYCALVAAPIDVAPLDTIITAPALIAPTARTYELRGATASTAAEPGSRASRAFGTITVSPTAGAATRTMAAGFASAQQDAGGCLRLRPGTVFSAGYVIENPPDASTFWSGFVRGYLYRRLTPLCGEETVFHLDERDVP